GLVEDLQPALAALDVPALRHAHRAVAQHPGRELPVAAGPLRLVPRANLAALPDRRSLGRDSRRDRRARLRPDVADGRRARLHVDVARVDADRPGSPALAGLDHA